MIGWWSESSVPEERGRDRRRPPLKRTEIGGGTRVKTSVLGRQRWTVGRDSGVCGTVPFAAGTLVVENQQSQRGGHPDDGRKQVKLQRKSFFFFFGRRDTTPHGCRRGRASRVRGTLPAPCPFGRPSAPSGKATKKGPSGGGGAKAGLARETTRRRFERQGGRPLRILRALPSQILERQARHRRTTLTWESIWFLGLGDQQPRTPSPLWRMEKSPNMSQIREADGIIAVTGWLTRKGSVSRSCQAEKVTRIRLERLAPTETLQEMERPTPREVTGQVDVS